MNDSKRHIPDLTKYLETGVRDGHTTFKLGVTIIISPEGQMWSQHNFLTLQDADLSTQVASHGTRQVAHALLTEALRRELYLCALVEQTKDSDFLSRFRESDEENRQKMALNLALKARQSMVDVLGKIGKIHGLEALEMLVAQLPPSSFTGDLPVE